MALLVEYKCEQIIPSTYYKWSTREYKVCKRYKQ